METSLRHHYIVERALDMRSGSEGPRHDPYGWEEISVVLNGCTITLRSGGLGYQRLSIDKKVVAEEWDAFPRRAIPNEAVKAFETLTGIPVKKFEKYYYRAHPYFNDPYGSLRDYE
jgi:hypothetical protein